MLDLYGEGWLQVTSFRYVDSLDSIVFMCLQRYDGRKTRINKYYQCTPAFASFTPKLPTYQTWEDPSNVLSETRTNGDNDPLEACEIGERLAYSVS